jgi:hypothetical protein
MPGSSTRLQHPKDPRVYAALGFDPALGFFVAVHGLAVKAVPYDWLTPGYNIERPLLGALAFLVDHGFCTPSQLEDALTYREVGGRKPRSRGAILALTAVEALTIAADS